jgi:hypothetical protein
MPLGCLLDLWECHRQFLGMAKPKREAFIVEDSARFIHNLFA